MTDAIFYEGWPYGCESNILCRVSPMMWVGLGVSLSLALSVLGASWGIWTCGTSIAGAGVAAPEIRGKHIVSIVFCEAVAIYGIIVAILIKQQIHRFHDFHPSPDDFQAGFIIFFAGLASGVCNLISGVSVGVCGSSTALGDAQNNKLFVRLLVIEIFATALGLFGVIVGIVMVSGLNMGTQYVAPTQPGFM